MQLETIGCLGMFAGEKVLVVLGYSGCSGWKRGLSLFLVVGRATRADSLLVLVGLAGGCLLSVVRGDQRCMWDGYCLEQIL